MSTYVNQGQLDNRSTQPLIPAGKSKAVNNQYSGSKKATMSSSKILHF